MLEYIIKGKNGSEKQFCMGIWVSNKFLITKFFLCVLKSLADGAGCETKASFVNGRRSTF
jgi:hypothetical protein